MNASGETIVVPVAGARVACTSTMSVPLPALIVYSPPDS
jgi:hypothetical protein